jgi:hypothetical protein
MSDLLAHHDLCFGCGLANPFGLQLEAAADGADRMRGRFFVKQDHQGAPGRAHPGVIAAALVEAMTLCAQMARRDPVLSKLDVELLGAAPIGTFVEVTAALGDDDGGGLRVVAAADGERGAVAQAQALFAGANPG